MRFCRIIIDIDHIFNRPIIVHMLGIKDYSGGLGYGVSGYTPKIFHGVDLAIGVSVVVYLVGGNTGLSTGLGLSLALHELWDYLVYPHKWTELLLITRVALGFRPGMRRKGSHIFDDNTLEY